MSYHLITIPNGVYGDISKIEEELIELKDAASQDIKIMELNELSDLIGAIEGYLHKKFPGMTLEDLIAMKVATARAFKTGNRKPKE